MDPNIIDIRWTKPKKEEINLLEMEATPHLLANRSLTYVDWSSFMLIHLVQPIKEVHGHNLVKGMNLYAIT